MFLVGVGLTVLLGLVALASRGRRIGGGDASQSSEPPRLLADYLATIFLILMPIGAALVVLMLVARRGRRAGDQTSQYKSALVFLAVVALISLAARLGAERFGRGEAGAGSDGDRVTTAQLVAELHELLERSDVEPPYVLVGSSVGGLNARYYALRYPSEVGGMVLVDSVHERVAAQLREVGRPPGPVVLVEDAAEELLRAGPNLLRDKPLIVVANGDRDDGWDALQRDLGNRSTNSSVLRALGSGHRIYADNPALVAAATRSVVDAARARSDVPRCTSRPFAALGGACLSARTTGPAARRARPAPARTERTPRGRVVRIGSDQLYIVCAGRGTPAVVVEAGLANEPSVWTPVQLAVAPATRVCTYQRLGERSAAPARPSARRTYQPGFQWPAVIVLSSLVLGLVLAAVAIAVWKRRTARTPEAIVAEAVAKELELTLDDLRAERDARRAVIAAYARMERVLAAHGLPRRVFEAPLEYLARVLGELHVSQTSVQRLTELFERAKFSTHSIDVTMKDDAIDALTALRDDLRRIDVPAHGPAPKAELPIGR